MGNHVAQMSLSPGPPDIVLANLISDRRDYLSLPQPTQFNGVQPQMRVIIAEDEALLRRGLTLILEQAGIEVVAAAADGATLLALTDQHRPDLVITDVRMPPTHTDEGMQAAKLIILTHPAVGLVVLSQHVQRRHAIELMTLKHAGVGYLLKQRIADIDTFCSDLHRVASGGTVLDPEVVGIMVTRAALEDDGISKLTPRQQQVLKMVAEGCSNVRIAAALAVTEKAVVQHTSRIYEALGLFPDTDEHRRVLAVLQYLAR